MCGLVGIFGDLQYQDEALMKKLLVFDYFRGTHSTGVAAISVDGESNSVAKIASHPFDLFDTGKYQKAVNAYKSQGFIGHNRAATKGSVNTVNAHPFEYGHIVGAHNGTLSDSSFKDLEKALGEKFDVDSQAVFAAIAKFGIEKTVPMLQGAWALTYFDHNEGTINFIRNKERPLWFAFTKDTNRLVWASEWAMIQAACSVSGTTDLLTCEEGYKFYPFEVDTLYTISLEDILDKNRPKDSAPEFKTKTLKGKEAAPVYSYSNKGSDPFTGRTSIVTGGKNGTTLTSRSNSTATTSGTRTGLVAHVQHDASELFGGLIDRDTFDYITKYGCSWCSASISEDDEGLVIMEDLEIVICSSCSDHTHNRFYASDETYSAFITQ